MELELKKDSVFYLKKVCDVTFTHEITQEAIVPDMLPDVTGILGTYANICLRGKDSDSGRAVVTGVAETSVVFSVNNGTAVRSLKTDIPFTVTTEAPEITSESSVVAKISLASAEAKMINSRKILVKLVLQAEIKCYNEAQLCVSCSVPDANGVEVLNASVMTDTVRSVTEKTFIISDDYSISSSKPPIGDILAFTSHLYTDEIKPVGNKLIISGRVGSSVLYLTDSGEDFESAEFSTLFSQIVELPEPSESRVSSTTLMLTGAYCSVSEQNDIRGLSVEIHAVAQCSTVDTTNVSYIADIFSTDNALKCEMSAFNISKMTEPSDISEIIRGTIPIDVAAEKIIRSDYYVSVSSISEKDNGCEAEAKAVITVIYAAQDHTVRSAKGSFTVNAQLPGMHCDSIFAVCVPSDELYVTPAGMELEIRLPVTLRISGTSSETVDCISEAVWCDMKESGADRPSVLLYRAQDGDDLWHIAKRYRTSQRLISEANSLENGSIRAGDLLLIPKAK